MKPASFEYHRATGIDEALALIARLGEDAKFIAGGQSLVALMNFRLARPSALVDISRLSELDYLAGDAGGLRIGALTRHRTVETATGLDGYGVLSAAARWIGHYPIRTIGTFGGSIAHADPTAEWCILATLLDAELVARGPDGERVIPAAEFFLGFLTTALAPDELLVEIRFPQPAPRSALTEFARRQGDFAIVAAAIAVETDGRLCTAARVALGGVDATPVRVADAEKVLVGSELTDDTLAEAGAVAAAAIEPGSDVHASADYRRHLTSVLVRRALSEALADDR